MTGGGVDYASLAAVDSDDEGRDRAKGFRGSDKGGRRRDSFGAPPTTHYGPAGGDKGFGGNGRFGAPRDVDYAERAGRPYSGDDRRGGVTPRAYTSTSLGEAT